VNALPFDSLYRHGFARLSVAVPVVRVSDVAHNVNATIALARDADRAGSLVVVFPELGLTGYSNDDLFQQEALLIAAEDALGSLARESAGLRPLIFVGLPVRHHARLYNVAVAVHRGRILGAVPKSYVPTYREFYERRQFTPGASVRDASITLCGASVPFGVDLLYQATDVPDLIVHTEICEDLWVPSPPSTTAALSGATVLANLSASNATIGKSDYRRSLGSGQSARCIAAHLYSAAGSGESTTDLAWDGDATIHENGRLLAESRRFSVEPQLINADVHLAVLAQDRMRMTTFADNAERTHAEREHTEFRRIEYEADPPTQSVRLERVVPRFPYVPADRDRRDDRCYEAYSIQVNGLSTRLRASGIPRVVIGVSGGLDSTQALIVSCRAMDVLGLPRTNVLAYTMPGFATSERTLRNAWALMRALGVTAEEIDIKPSCMQMLRDLGHPFAGGQRVYDVTFENVQAGERTSHLFRLANHLGALVVGTGDLSELALGWATYGVGDHMSHYGVNASVPKTLIQHLIRWSAERGDLGDDVRPVLLDILDTEISPELVPADAGSDGDQPAQRSEATIGPYELQDFHLYYLTRYGLAPSTVAYLAEVAWADAQQGAWPDDIPVDRRNAYTRNEIVRWLTVFLTRFFGSTQFKRTCVPNAPKVGSGGSLSPRGDWRAPSDSVADVWIAELMRNCPPVARDGQDA
jgi:NAD+ synthase (glutamine-hydrolysing)